MTSLMVLILSSVRAEVLLLRRQTWQMSFSDHSPTFLSNSSSGHGSRGGGWWPGSKWFSTALLHLEHRQILLKAQMEKKASIRKSTIQPISRSNLENVQLWLGKTWNESDTNHLSAQGGHSQVGKAERHPGRQCLCCNKKRREVLGSRKDGTVNSTRKGKQEELQRTGSTGTGPRRIRNISPQQRQERKFQIKIPSTDLHTHNTHKNSMSFK